MKKIFGICLLFLSMAVNAALVDQGNGTISDTSQNLLWTANNNLGPGNVSWFDAQTIVSGLSTAGITTWRLATIDELDNMYSALTPAERNLFTAPIDSEYWSDTESSSTEAWGYDGLGFDFGFDPRFVDPKSHVGNFVIAVTNVPAPAAVWLFGTGLLGLVGIARRKNAS